MARRILPLLLALLLLAGCGSGSGDMDPSGPAPGGPSPSEPPPDSPFLSEAELEVTCGGGPPLLLACRVVDGAGEEALLATLPQEGDMYEGVFRLTAGEVSGRFWRDPVRGDDGRVRYSPAVFEDIADGMLLYVVCDDVDQSEFPGVFVGVRSAEIVDEQGNSPVQVQIEPGRWFDLCGLYLRVLDDLWVAEPKPEYPAAVAVDLSAAPGGLTEQERAALVWRFGQLRGVEAVEAELWDRPECPVFIFTISLPTWDVAEYPAAFTGSVPAGDRAERGDTLYFSASRNGTAPVSFRDCAAHWTEGGGWTGYEPSAAFR